MARIKILILAANPGRTAAAGLEQEVRDISEGLKRAQQRERFELESRWAVTARDLVRALIEVRPDIVQFSGVGGDEQGVILETVAGTPNVVQPDVLASAFSLCNENVRCVLLNAGSTTAEAKAVSQHIDYVIGIAGKLEPGARMEFSVGFYTALGAGRPVEPAFEWGKVGMGLAGYGLGGMPTLFKRDGAPVWPGRDAERGAAGGTGEEVWGAMWATPERPLPEWGASAGASTTSAPDRAGQAGRTSENGPIPPPEDPRELVFEGDRALIVQIDREIVLPFARAFERIERVPRRWDAFLASEMRTTAPNPRIWRRLVGQVEDAVSGLAEGLAPGACTHVFVMAPHAAALLVGERLGRLARDMPLTLQQWNDHTMQWGAFTVPPGRWKVPEAEPFLRSERESVGALPGTLLTLEVPHLLTPEHRRTIAALAGVGGIYRLVAPFPGARIASLGEARGAVDVLMSAIRDIDQPPARTPLHIATSAPVVLLVELGRRIRQTVEPEVIAWQYDRAGDRYTPILEIMGGEAVTLPDETSHRRSITTAQTSGTPTPARNSSTSAPAQTSGQGGHAWTRAEAPPEPDVEVLKEMRKALAQIFTDVLQIQIVAEDAGLPWERIPHGGSPESVWRNVLKEASLHGTDAVRAVLREALGRYPRNTGLLALKLKLG